mgnify:FL=1
MTLKYSVAKQVPFKYKHCYTIRRLHEQKRDKSILKEYAHGYLRFINARMWKHKRKQVKRLPRIYGGFHNEYVPTYKTETVCRTMIDSFYREFILVNQEKTEFCIGIHDKFMDFRVKDFLQPLPSVKNSLIFVANLKRKLYCDLCDAHAHEFFNIKDKKFVISKQFCKKVLKYKIDYFKFMHIVWIEFVNQILQYQACFETDAQVFEFPFQNFMAKYLRRIPLVKKCLSSLDDKKNFYKNCWMICELYRYDTFAPFFDGDVEMLRRVNVSLLSFLRKLDLAEVKEDKRETKAKRMLPLSEKEKNKKIMDEMMLPENVDGTLIEPLNPGHYITDGYFYAGKDDRLRLFGKDRPQDTHVGIRPDQEQMFNRENTLRLN